MTVADDLDPYDVRLALGAGGRLGGFNRAGVLDVADVHVATTLGRLGGETDEQVLLAVAFAVRAVRLGSVCIDLRRLRGVGGETTDDDLPWPDIRTWQAACAASPLIAVGSDGDPSRPLRMIDDRLYLDRYWRQEQLIRRELAGRGGSPVAVDETALRAASDALFPDGPGDAQRLAAVAAATGRLTVVAGGPGTGKTTTVARLVALLHRVMSPEPRIALAAPTGKAAARLQEAVGEELETLRAKGLWGTASAPTASTLHRLLGWRPDSRTRFRHDAGNRLPFDAVIVDETSMVSLTLMSRLVDAVRPGSRLVLVGDPDQLASVEAGAVLGDLAHRPVRPGADERLELLRRVVPADIDTAVDTGAVEPGAVEPADVTTDLRRDVVRLRRQYRYGGVIGELAEAVRAGDAARVIAQLRSGAAEVEFVDAAADARLHSPVLRTLRDDLTVTAAAVLAAAQAGDAAGALAALNHHRVLCAHRRGPYGVTRWNAEIERLLGDELDGFAATTQWYVGRPLLVTSNDYELKLYNGDTGVVIDDGTGVPVAALATASGPVRYATGRLSGVETVHAMTVHRAQGSQYDRATVLLPAVESPLLTRELLYTAATRAREGVRIVGTEAAVARAVDTPILRASGLRE